MREYEILIDALGHKKKLDFNSHYKNFANERAIPLNIFIEKSLWENLEEHEAINILIQAKKWQPLMWILEKDSGWQLDKNDEDKVFNYLAAEPNFHKVGWGVSQIVKERIKNRAMNNQSQKLQSKPLKLKEDFEPRISKKSMDEIQKHFRFNVKEFLSMDTPLSRWCRDCLVNFRRTSDRVEFLKSRLPREKILKDMMFKYKKPIQWTEKAISKVKEKATKLPGKPLKLGEHKMSLRDFLDDKEEEQLDKELKEDVFGVIGSALGYTIGAAALAFGGMLLIIAGKKYVLKMKDLWQKIFSRKKKPNVESKSAEQVMREIEADAKVKSEKAKIEAKKRTYEDKLHEVYLAIESKDFNAAKEAFYQVDRNLQNSPDVHKAIIFEVTKVLKEPPLYVKSPGNTSYQAIKKLINIRVARAAASAVQQSLVSASGGETE